jgi:uncharacterized protein YciI
MLFFVRFTDRPDRLNVRERHLRAHLEWLDAHPEVVAAGSLRKTGEAPVGACWIVRAADVSEVEGVFASDPFWTEGLRESVEILQWSQAFPDRPFST